MEGGGIPNEETNIDKQTNPKPNRKPRKRTTTKKEINLATVNVRGVKGKTKSLESLLAAGSIHVAAISDTHLQNKETINIKGYSWTGNNRRNKTGGGVGILLRNDINGSSMLVDNSEAEET